MVMSNWSGNIPQLDESIFTESFHPLAVHAEDNKLDGIELVVVHGASSYTLNIETFALHALRAVESTEEDAAKDRSMVISADEITPTDLIALRDGSFEDLIPFLTRQETS